MPKIITTGQGGCLTTNNDYYADRIKKLKDFGRTGGGLDIHNEFGINSKFTEFQAITGLSQIKDIEWRINRKKEIYSLYYNSLKDIIMIDIKFLVLDLITPWFVDIYIIHKRNLIERLNSKGIQTREVYPSIPSQKIYNKSEKYEITEHLSKTGLWLPSSLTLTNDDINFICKEIKKMYGR
jgi:perosamine synthetase